MILKIIISDNTKQHVLVVQKNDAPQVKLVQSGIVTSGTKTITIAQAQQMGYLTNSKIVPTITTGKQTIMLNKATAPKGLKLVPQVVSSKSICSNY